MINEIFCMLNLTFKTSEDFKNYINTTNERDFAVDVTSMNIFDSLKFMVMSSAYFYQKYPEEKLKCKIKSNDIRSLISAFEVKNLEFV
ncbi:hypothetical protein J6P92_03860 [bacterium]|nr:hypothetical protein [bacterium]